MTERQQLRGCLGRRHISDQQSFPFESKKRPKLWDGAWSLEERYTQLDARELVEYARLRGVRVIVEFVSRAWRCRRLLACSLPPDLKSDSKADSC